MVPHVDRPRRAPRLPISSAPRLCLLAAFLTIAGTSSANAQHVRGQLLDLRSNDPIPSGFLTLLAEDSSIVTRAVSDGQGFWRLDVPRAGVYYVVAERIGYQRWVSAPLEVGATDELNTIFHLPPSAVRLDAIDVRAASVRRYLEHSGFFERQRGNFGHFVTPEAIEKRQAARHGPADGDTGRAARHVGRGQCGARPDPAARQQPLAGRDVPSACVRRWSDVQLR
jgi:hypothetical protein